jgi:hypothetical protein
MSREIEDNNITQNESTRNANLDHYIRNNNIRNYRRFNATFFIIIIMSIALIIILIVLCISFSTKNNNNRKKTYNNNGKSNNNNNNNGKPNITGKETQRTDTNTEKTDVNIVIESDTSEQTEIICDSGFFLPKDNYSKCFKCAIDNCDKCNGNKNSNICTSCKKGFKTIYEENKKVIKACEFFCEQGEKEKCFKCNETDNKCLSCNSGYYIPEDDDSKNDCQKCSITNCKECKGTRSKNLCINCDSNLIPYYENNIIISCNNCSIGKDEKCLTCGKIKNECGSCNPGYILKDGNCIINYAFKAQYYTDQNNINIPLINNSYINKIIINKSKHKINITNDVIHNLKNSENNYNNNKKNIQNINKNNNCIITGNNNPNIIRLSKITQNLKNNSVTNKDVSIKKQTGLKKYQSLLQKKDNKNNINISININNNNNIIYNKIINSQSINNNNTSSSNNKKNKIPLKINIQKIIKSPSIKKNKISPSNTKSKNNVNVNSLTNNNNGKNKNLQQIKNNNTKIDDKVKFINIQFPKAKFLNIYNTNNK